MNKNSTEENIAAIIKSNLVSFTLSHREISKIAEETTSDLMQFLEDIGFKKEIKYHERTP